MTHIYNILCVYVYVEKQSIRQVSIILRFSYTFSHLHSRYLYIYIYLPTSFYAYIIVCTYDKNSNFGIFFFCFCCTRERFSPCRPVSCSVGTIKTLYPLSNSAITDFQTIIITRNCVRSVFIVRRVQDHTIGRISRTAAALVLRN